jgi:Fibronectin type III domain
MTVPPNQSLTMAVNFVPAAPGDVTGTLLVSSNAVNSTVQVGLSGTGVTANASGHSVMVSWTPSTSPVIGYFIYRGAVSGGPYVKLNSSVDPNPSYTDSGLASGSYFYVVTSVDINGDESGFSNEVEVDIP